MPLRKSKKIGVALKEDRGLRVLNDRRTLEGNHCHADTGIPNLTEDSHAPSAVQKLQSVKGPHSRLGQGAPHWGPLWTEDQGGRIFKELEVI